MVSQVYTQQGGGVCGVWDHRSGLRSSGRCRPMASLQIAPLPAPDVPAFELTSVATGRVPSDLLRTLARAILHAREEEGRRIARELHDDAGQLIASAFLALDEVERSLPEDGRGRLEDAKRTLGQVERHLRRLSHELRPPVLD